MGMIKSFDVIGSKEKAVAIVEIPEGMSEKAIAEEVMKFQKSVKSVLCKTSERKGEFRNREYKLIAGDKNTEVVHKEYGCSFRLDPQKVYFSSREGTERQRIAKQVKPNEKILVMFGGVAPFAIIIAKIQPKVGKVYSIELNPDGHRYAEENIRLNRIGDKVTALQGDVREVCKKFSAEFDRIVMPLPLGAESFLDVAVNCLKEGGVIHFYNWGGGENPFESAEQKIKESLIKLNKKYQIIHRQTVLPYAPGKYKVCMDFKVV